MPEFTQDASFPKGGIDQSNPFWKQPPRPGGGGLFAADRDEGDYVKTTRFGRNVRAAVGFPGSRNRGGSRGGLVRYIDAKVSGSTWAVQQLDTLVAIDVSVPGGGVPQTSLSGRVVFLVAVSRGEVYTASPGGTAWSHATNNTGETPPLNADGVMFSAQNIQRLYFCDGINYAYYSPVTDSVEAWTASTAGTLPLDSDNNAATLICTWRGRTVLSGLLKDPQNVFLSAVGDPHDWDYAPASPSQTQAVALNLSDLGFIGEAVTCLIPCTDDVLIVGCVNSIRAIRGDPMAGGQVDLISDSVGMVWGQPYAKDAEGNIYFFSNRAGVFKLNPNSLAPPVKVSGPVDQYMVDLDTGANHVRMAWDDRYDTLQVFVTAISEPTETYHFAYETATRAWWLDRLADTDFDPLAACVLDGNEPGDRVVVLGSWDGYVRTFDPSATADDLLPIESEVWIGPFLTKDMDEVVLSELQAVLAEDSGSVNYAVHVGRSAQEAFESEAFCTGSWDAGRGFAEAVRAAGHAIYLRVTSDEPWQLEQIRATLVSSGKATRRRN